MLYFELKLKNLPKQLIDFTFNNQMKNGDQSYEFSNFC